MKFLRKLLGIEDQSRLIEKRFSEIQEKVMAEVASLRNENFSLKSENQQKNNRITELLEKLRDQNEADLLLEAKRIEKKILDGEKRSEINTNVFAALKNQLMNYQSQLAAQRNMGGLSSLFGAYR